MHRVNLDLDVLRTFVTGVELGSFAKAAERLARSSSAVSSQLKKLEGQAGTTLLRKDGRGLGLTDAGEAMLGYARRLLALNDEAVDAIAGQQLEGWVRLGLQEDFGETLLSGVLGRFARAHPRIRVEARIARNAELLDGVASGRLDLALAWQDGARLPHSETIAELPMCWIGSATERHLVRAPPDPLPLVSLEAPCVMRRAATDALDQAGVPWRIAFVSQSLGGIWAAAAAGLGITVRTEIGLPSSVEIRREVDWGLPALPRLSLALCRSDAEPGPAAARLAAILSEAVRERIARPYLAPPTMPEDQRVGTG